MNLPFWVLSIGLTVLALQCDPRLAVVPPLLAALFFGLTWLQRFNTRYRLTSQRLIVERGILSRQTDEIELFRVVDTKASESLAERIVNLGNITVTSADRTGSVLIDKVPGARAKREQIRNLSEKNKQERNTRVISNIEQA